MKSNKSSGVFRPFKDLRSLLKSKDVVLKSHTPYLTKANCDGNPNPDEDRALFLKAMAGVKPIPKGKYIERSCKCPTDKVISHQVDPEESKTLARLKKLIESGEGFIIADTPEYIDGAGYHVHPTITRYLHQGYFSVQAHIDLHGLTVVSAKEAIDAFFRESIRTGKRTVLVVHGRGLSSPNKPILKAKVCEWLTNGVWRKWVIAFTSARHCDGGAGATYVLLRGHPVTKKLKKRSSIF
jgi:DNA-nicking Smr family endonuclease